MLLIMRFVVSGNFNGAGVSVHWRFDVHAGLSVIQEIDDSSDSLHWPRISDLTEKSCYT